MLQQKHKEEFGLSGYSGKFKDFVDLLCDMAKREINIDAQECDFSCELQYDNEEEYFTETHRSEVSDDYLSFEARGGI